MGVRTKWNIMLVLVTLYCALSWVLMRSDYFVRGEETAAAEQFIHLLFTAGMLFLVVFWNGHRIERFIERVSALPMPGRIAPFAAGGILVFTMLYYPRTRVSRSMVGWEMMESTRALVEYSFQMIAAMGLASLILLNGRRVTEEALRHGEKLLFGTPRTAFVIGMMLLVFLETNALSLFQFHHVPVSSDEVGYIFQAKVFADGRLYAEPPPDPEFFRFSGFVLRDKWYSTVAPGFPLLLTLGVFLGATWIVNPLLSALCVMLVYMTAEHMYDVRIARISSALMLVSPFFLLLSSIQLAHTATTFFFLSFLYLFLKGLKGSGLRSFLLSGLAFGAMMLTSPLAAAAASLPWGAYCLWLVAKQKIPSVNAMALGAGLIFGLGLLLAYNSATAGDPLAFGSAALDGNNFEVGQPLNEPLARETQTLLGGIVTLNGGLHRLNRYLLGWPVPALLLVFLPFALPTRSRWDWLLLGHLLSIAVVCAFSSVNDLLMGPRYYFSAIPAGLILTARGFREAPVLWNRLTGRMDSAMHVAMFSALVVCICIVYNAVSFFPQRLRYYAISSPVYRFMPSPIWRHLEAHKVGNAVVFIGGFPNTPTYGTGLWRNDPELEGDVIFARDLGMHNDVLMERYPGRSYYRYAPLTDSFQEIFPSDDSTSAESLPINLLAL